MKILVTGGAGFIGSNFIHYYLNNHNDKIVNLDALTYAGRKENLFSVTKNKILSKRYSFIKGNVSNPKIVSKAVKGCDAVIHFAAETHVDRSIADPMPFLKTDVVGTGVLLEQARKNDLRFIHISTDEVYGNKKTGRSLESDPFKPSSPYSASKAGGDGLAYSYYHTYGLNVSIVRPSNNYGPNQFPEKVIPLFITNLLRNKKVPVYGRGDQKRDWLFVEDCCSAVDTVFKKGGKGQAYNVAAGNETRNIVLTKTILKELGKGNEMIKHVKDRLGHDTRYALNSNKIKKLGWKPMMPLSQGLKKTIDWYKVNQWWWKPLVK